MSWVVYILQSTLNGKLYTGMSNDVVKRLAAHNTGRGARFTKVGRPWVLVYVEHVESRSAALKREYRIKQLSRATKLQLVKAFAVSGVSQTF